MQERASKNTEKGVGKEGSILLRNVPVSLRKALRIRATQEDKSMQGLILELISRYVESTPINDKGGR